MTAVWMRARAELRAGRRSLIALALLLGIFGAVAMTAGAGARRTDSAYDRFVAATNRSYAESVRRAPAPAVIATAPKIPSSSARAMRERLPARSSALARIHTAVMSSAPAFGPHEDRKSGV